MNKQLMMFENKATLSGCPVNYQGIANGCYFIMNTTQVDQATANSMCVNNYSATAPVVTHLLAFESLAESIAMLIWLKGRFEALMDEGRATLNLTSPLTRARLLY